MPAPTVHVDPPTKAVRTCWRSQPRLTLLPADPRDRSQARSSIAAVQTARVLVGRGLAGSGGLLIARSFPFVQRNEADRLEGNAVRAQLGHARCHGRGDG